MVVVVVVAPIPVEVEENALLENEKKNRRSFIASHSLLCLCLFVYSARMTWSNPRFQSNAGEREEDTRR